MSLRVLIAGAGIGGLALAQGLRKEGVRVSVFERDRSPEIRGQGYRIHLDPHGLDALRRVLPAPLFELCLATADRRPSTRVSTVDETLTELGRYEFEPQEAARHTAVNRLTLRQILLHGLGSSVQFDRAVVGAEQSADGVRVLFADGRDATGDVLVAADGIGSVLRGMQLPGAEVVDTGVRYVYGRTPLASSTVPEWLFAGFTGVVGPAGRSMALGTFQARQPIAAAARQFAPGLRLDPVADYLMWAVGGPAADLPDLGGAPAALHRLALDLTEGWHPTLRAVLDNAEVSACFGISIRTSVPIPAWPTSNITFLGDAIHAMTPAGGVGANTALRDAALLTDILAEIDRGERQPREALADYESRMRDYGFAAVTASRSRSFSDRNRVERSRKVGR
jgi:salicylate hydroxylase